MNIAIGLFAFLLAADRPVFTTEFERSGGTRTGDYAETETCLRALDAASSQVHVLSIGETGEGRPMWVAIFDRDGIRDPEKARRAGRAVVFVQGGIHAGEIDGKDASLLLLRELAAGKHQDRVRNVTLLVLPVFNIDGHENRGRWNRANQKGPEITGFRANATNLNLNRDYIKADAPETRAWLSFYNEWRPELFVDCHVTDGADHQHVITYTAERWSNSDPGVARWTRDVFSPELENRMRADGFPLLPYADYRTAHQPLTGLKWGPLPPRFATGYAAIRNRAALLVEAHMLKDYATRVRGTHAMLVNTVAVVNQHAADLQARVKEADAYAASEAFRTTELLLKLETDFTDSVLIDLKGFDQRMVTSQITGAEYPVFGTTPTDYRVPLFAAIKAKTRAVPPAAYLVPKQWKDVIALLEQHGVKTTTLAEACDVRIESTRLAETSWKATSFEGHHEFVFKTKTFAETRRFPAGTVVVDLAQPEARVAVHLLEAEAPDALLLWGYFDSAFEQREYMESYLIEPLMAKMLTDDAALKREFLGALADSSLVRTPDAIRAWFYKRTPYWESRLDVYPVARIVDPAELAALKKVEAKKRKR